MESEPVSQKDLKIEFRELGMRTFSAFQETKCQQGQVELELPGYHQYWNYAERKGYSRNCGIYKERADLCEKWYRN